MKAKAKKTPATTKPFLIQPLHLCMKLKIRLIPSWSQLSEPLHICQSRLCKLWSAGWREKFYTLNSISLKSIIDLSDASIRFCPTKFEKSGEQLQRGKRGCGCAGFSFSYCSEGEKAKGVIQEDTSCVFLLMRPGALHWPKDCFSNVLTLYMNRNVLLL